MLPILRAPPKEGRQNPSQLFAHASLRNSRQRNIISFFFIFIVLVFIYLSRHLTSGLPGTTHVHTRSGLKAEPSHGFSSNRPEISSQVSGDNTESILERSNDDQHVFLKDAVDLKHRPNLDNALGHVINLMPDELESQYILHQVARLSLEPDALALKSLGLLVRKYRKLFVAWENLHVARDTDGSSYVHDDVIQYLRDSSASSLDDDHVTKNAELRHKIQSYEAYRQFLTKLGQSLFPWTAPYHAEHIEFHSTFARGGRGIVLTAGNSQASFLLTSIPTIRQLGCKLPIEIMYVGDSDLKEDLRHKLESLEGVITRDVSLMINPAGWTLSGWAIKPFAMLLSSFREIIFIDADSLFLQSPEILFDSEDYNRTGALFFRDRLILPESKQQWLRKLLPKPISDQVKKSRPWVGTSGHMQESGVLVVDKWRHFMPLLLVAHLNGPLSKGMYKMVYGDKETFWLGWELVGDLDYAFHQGDTGTMGVLHEMQTRPIESNSSEVHYEICSPQLLHLDTNGKPLWFNGWIVENKFEPSKKDKIASFEHYLRESDDQNTHWKVLGGNVCCLWGLDSETESFTPEEKQVLQLITNGAKKVRAGIPV